MSAAPDPSPAMNALEERNQRYGSNSYYYAHAKPGTAASTHEGPRKIGGHSGPVRSTPVVSISKYSWCDGKKSVKIYVEIPGVEAAGMSAIDVKNTSSSVTMSVVVDGLEHVLGIPKLYDVIDDAVASIKPGTDRITLALKKPKDKRFSWFHLKKD